ncbi:MAG: Cytochrome c [Gemmataceae bacterium]|nr:Cytochrome c [Gemmataceae bacterium]
MPGIELIRGRSRGAAVAALAVVLSGCGGPPPYPPDLTFPVRDDRLVLRVPTAQPGGTGEPGKLDAELAGLDALGGRTAEPSAVPAVHRQTLDRFLAETFGTPATPTVTGTEAVTTAAAKLGLTPERLTEGGKLYRRHCLQCHGLSGDGRGPTGQWIYPHPRDFRRGAFKFVSAGDGGKPRPADLARTLRDGLKGTAMPAFGLLPEGQRELMAAYAVYLSLRGQTEFLTLAALLAEDDGEGGVDGDPVGFARDRLIVLLRQWERAATTPPGPPPPSVLDDAGKQDEGHLESVRRGYDLFMAKGVTDCATCHEDFGRKATYRYDVWGTVVRPADLTAGGFKGGDRPEDLYHRIRGGIQPAGMPAHPGLTDTQVWDLAHFVRALPYPRELPPAVRGAVYPGK